MSDKARLATFHEIYQRYSQDIYRFALYLSGNPDQAADVVSETFLRAWASPQEVRTETVKSYLLVIARNMVGQTRRNSWRNQEFTPEFPSPENIEKDAQVRERWRQTTGNIQLLSESERSALLLRALDGLSYNEISVALGIPAATAKVQVHRARLKLAEALQTKSLLEKQK